jgi:hypothetical protein
MIDAFNVTEVRALGYSPSDLSFADPVDARWRAKKILRSVLNRLWKGYCRNLLLVAHIRTDQIGVYRARF